MSAPIIDITNPATAQTIGGELLADVTSLTESCGQVTITTVEDLEVAVTLRARIGAARKKVLDFFDPLTLMAHRLHLALTARRGEILSKLDGPDRQLADAMAFFKREQDRLRHEQELAEAALRLKEQQDAAVTEAAALETRGEVLLAAAVVQEALAAPPPIVALPDVTRAAGAKFTRYWKWKFAGGPRDITQTPPAVLEAALKQIPVEYLKVDTVKVGGYVRSMKSSASIPGIDIFYEDIPVR